MSAAKAGRRGSMLSMDIRSLGRAGAEDAMPEHVPFEPRLPQVNLLPASVRDALRTARLRRLFVLLLLLLVVASAGIWYLQSDRISRAEDAVATATVRNEQLRDDLAAMAPVRRMYEQITRLQGIVTATLATQPLATAVNERLIAAGEAATDGDVVFRSIDVVYSGLPAPGGQLNPCPNPDPFSNDIAIGCLTFDAVVQTREQVSDMLRRMEADPMFVGPYVTTSNVSEIEDVGDVVTFTGSAAVSLEGLAVPLTQEQIDAILAPPEEESSVTTGDGATDGAAGEGTAGATDEAGTEVAP